MPSGSSLLSPSLLSPPLLSLCVYFVSSCTSPAFAATCASVLATNLAATLDTARAAARVSTLASTVVAALGWLWQAGNVMWLLLVGGDEGGESCSRLRRQPGAGTEVGVQQEDESLTLGRARGIWACWSRVRWHATRWEWKQLCRCAVM